MLDMVALGDPPESSVLFRIERKEFLKRRRRRGKRTYQGETVSEPCQTIGK